ncbi:MAG: hypothetical protein KDF64_11970 [Geminicoccaceae bacterium]|nr:hypothetical protein [Geminicoccaceae bacterium]
MTPATMSSANPATGKHLGITVMPEWIQSEGIDGILENLARAGATAVATSPYVMAASDAPDAGREPPIDGGSGKVRLLDRDLWGRRELRCVTAPAFRPDPALYAGLACRPSPVDELTMREGDIIARFLERAKAAGLEVQLQVQAAIPPGYRVQFGGPAEADQPRLPDGGILANRVDRNGSLASPAIVDYACALLRDIARAYPMVDAVRVDWPEYPPYSLRSWFFDFSDHAVRAMHARGLDVETMRADCLALMREPWRFLDEGLFARPGFTALLDFKRDLSAALLQALRDALPGHIRLIAHAFPEPWNRLSGADPARMAAHADEIAVKLYTMHWPMMLADYRDAMRTGCHGDDPGDRLRALFDTGGEGDLHYPEPDEPHPVGRAAQIRKIAAARATGAPIMPAAHSYGPTEDVAARIDTAFRAGGNAVWVNRYGYLGNDKLDALGAMMRRES